MSVLTPVNFLDCVQRVALDVGVASLPTTTVNASGQVLNLCAWVNEAWLEIQRKHVDWWFLRVSPGVSFATVAGQTTYTASQAGVTAGAVGAWARDTFRNYQTSVGTPSENFMTYIEYDHWRDGYLLGALRTSQVRPQIFTITPSLSLGVQCPLAGYTITGDYYTLPVPFAADGDIPSIPNQYIMAIVYLAEQYYAAFENAAEVYVDAERHYKRVMNKMESHRLKEIQTSGALA
jgi:hypothetical protein